MNSSECYGVFRDCKVKFCCLKIETVISISEKSERPGDRELMSPIQSFFKCGCVLLEILMTIYPM